MAPENGKSPPSSAPADAAGTPGVGDGPAPPEAGPTSAEAADRTLADSKPLPLQPVPDAAPEATTSTKQPEDDGPVSVVVELPEDEEDGTDNGPASVEVSLTDLEMVSDAPEPEGESEGQPSEGWSKGPSSLAELYAELTEEERADGARPWWLDEDSHDRSPAKRPSGPPGAERPGFSPSPLDRIADTKRPTADATPAKSRPSAPRDGEPKSPEPGAPRPSRKSRSGRRPGARKRKGLPRPIPLPPPEAKADPAHALARTSKAPAPPARRHDGEADFTLPPGIDGASTLTSELGPPSRELGPPSSMRLRDALAEPSIPPAPIPSPPAVVAPTPKAALGSERKPVNAALLGSVLVAALAGGIGGYVLGRSGSAETPGRDAATDCPCLPGSGARKDVAGAPGDERGADRARAEDQAAADQATNVPLGPGRIPTSPSGAQDGGLSLAPEPGADGGPVAAADPQPTAGPLGTVASAPSAQAAGAFDPAQASAALSAAAGGAAGCRTDSSEGPAAVTVAVTFAPSGRVTTATIMGGQFAGTPVGGCIAQAFKAARVPAFEGDPVTVKKTVRLP